jgi:hypothetical protein
LTKKKKVFNKRWETTNNNIIHLLILFSKKSLTT